MRKNPAATILRWGLAFVFFYSSVSVLRDAGGADLWTAVFAAYELLLAMWLFTGMKTVWSSLAATATFGIIVLLNLFDLDGVFSNVGLAFAALALFELSRKG